MFVFEKKLVRVKSKFNVLGRHLKLSKVATAPSSCGREFHAAGPAYEKDRSYKVAFKYIKLVR